MRASAGILFAVALITFMHAFLLGNFQPTRVFVVAFVLVCGLCLVFMFFESAFGICIGCKVYNLFNQEQAQLCPGGVCETSPAQATDPAEAARCQVPEFAKAIGHEAMWKLHNGCPP